MRLEVTEGAPHNLQYPYTGRLEPGDTFEVSTEKAEALLERHDYLVESDEIHLNDDQYEVIDDDGDDEDLSGLTKSELYERATEADIDGRSTMSKAELIDALRED